MSGKKSPAPDALGNLKGVGPKTEALLSRAGITSLRALLSHYPREYESYDAPVQAGAAEVGAKCAVLAQVRQRPTVKTFGGKSITMLPLADETGRLQVDWFNLPYLRSTLQPGSWYVFRGMVTEKNGRRLMAQPELFSADAYRGVEGKLLPIYSLTAGVSNKLLRRLTGQALAYYDETGGWAAWPDTLPEDFRAAHGLLPLSEAVRRMHMPERMEALQAARRRLAFEEFFWFLLGVARLRGQNAERPNAFPMRRTWLAEQVIDALPYQLTGAQAAVWTEIERDLAGAHLLRRLVQGDVGSGKTILAFLAMVMAMDNGYQSALMAPTEVLAAQHFESLCALLERAGIQNARPVLLTGSCRAAERKKIYADLADGTAHMAIGTHALFQDAVAYRELGLVITDEQHRFGVQQRAALAQKGAPPHMLVMSATPIPRTLALMLYGDLDISALREMPAHRLPIKNAVVDAHYRETAYRFMEKEVRAGHQVYIICPMVEPNEELNCANVTEYTKDMEQRFAGIAAVGMLHGQLRPKEKQRVMAAFAAGDIQILVSTTVVEVGVNVPNATVMLVESAERFGMAQLHQLRGRVGRGKAQSYCIFLQGAGGKDMSKRLEVLQKTNDGFAIAEEDLRLRGPGDLFGVRQSGEALFGAADIYRDADVLKEAAAAVKALLAEDPQLSAPAHAALADELARKMAARVLSD